MKFCLEGGKACFWTVFFFGTLLHCCIFAAFDERGVSFSLPHLAILDWSFFGDGRTYLLLCFALRELHHNHNHVMYVLLRPPPLFFLAYLHRP